MSAVFTVLHVIVCVFLVVVVLLQRGKGAQIGAVFGGGAGSTLFGSRGAGNFLTKLTAIAATIYMVTSLSLSYFGITDAGQRLFQEGAEIEAPVEGSLFEEVGTAPAEVPASEQPAAEALEPAPAGDEPAAAPGGTGAEAPAPDAG